MAEKGSKRLPPAVASDMPLGGLNQELADAFSNAVFGLLEHSCSCPSAKFVRLLVKYRKDMFKGGQQIGEDYYTTED